MESPPEMPEQLPRGAGQLLMILPMICGVGAMMLMYGNRGGSAGNPFMYIIGGLFGVSMLAMVIGQIGGGNRGEEKAKLDGERRDYMRYLSQVRKRARRAASQQRSAAEWRHPLPEALWSLIGSVRQWERRSTDEDFAEVRVAVGAQRMVVKIVTPETKPVEDLEPMSAIALRRFIRAHNSVPDLPVALSLRAFSRVVLRGEEDATDGFLRAVLCQLVTLQAPDDLLIAVVATPDRHDQWSWLKWLPHTQHPRLTDAVGPRRMVFESLSELERSLNAELAGRPRGGTAQKGKEATHLVVILDGGAQTMDDQLAGRGLSGVTVIDTSGVIPRDSGSWMMCLEVSQDELAVDSGKKRSVLGKTDTMSLPQAEGLARQLAPFRQAPQAPEEAEEVLDVATELPELLGFDDAANLDPSLHWQRRPIRDQLRVPMGLGPAGNPVHLDIKEASLDGMGPHGLMVGATGSGKSEALRTLVGALAARHSSEELNFVLVDFKGGATFAPLVELPHTSAVITNLADELTMVDRMKDALAGEMVRRQELLRAAGNYVNRHEYEKARLAGEDLEPLPSLMVVCDEFSEMLAAKPDFIDLFIQVGRIGRSIGVHLLLASQRLEEGKLRGLDTYLSYRIGLRTFSAVESRIVLGVADAYELPQAPGHGYLKVGTEQMERFRCAYVSGPYRAVTTKPRAQEVLQGQIMPFELSFTEPPVEVDTSEEVAAEPVPTQPDATEGGKETSMLEVMIERMRGKGKPAHQVWLPPLEAPASLDALIPPMDSDPERGLSATGWELNGKLTAIVGEVDRPFEQKRTPMLVPLDGAGGNAAVVGAQQSGKSTLLRAMISSLALTHTPREVQFMCLDFGGGTMRPLLDLPHVSGVFGRRDVEGVRRTISEIKTIVDEREERFTAHGIDNAATYRRRKAAGEFADDPFGDVFLIVDGWGTVRQDFEAYEQELTYLAGRCLGFGVHMVVSATRWAEIRMALRDMFGTKLELRLGESNESEIDRKAAANVPLGTPGRGLTSDLLHYLAAVPRIDGTRDADNLAPGVSNMAERISKAWTGPPAQPVRLLPRELPVAELASQADPAAKGIPFGIQESNLRPVYLDFDDEPNLIIIGDSECGKSSALRYIAQSLTERYTPDECRIIMGDYRRGMLGAIDTPHLLSYSPSAKPFEEAIKALKPRLSKRVPGPDITPEQLAERSWWEGPEVFIIVDDYDLVASVRGNPLLPLLDLIPQARDIGMHIIVARRSAGVARGLNEALMQRLRELDSPGLLMSGKREEGQVFGKLRPSPQPAGRGTLVRRRDGENLVQLAWRDSS